MNIIDLSQPIHAGMPVFPGAGQPQFQQLATVEDDGFRVANTTINYHVGTHVDAPAHMIATGKTLDHFLADYFVGKAAIADFTEVPSGRISLEAIQKYESIIRQVEFLLIKTGWSQYWGSGKYFDDYPTLTPEAAKWLTGFSLKGIGLDTMSIDPIDSTDFTIHKILLSKEILIVENLNKLERIADEIFEFFSLPLWIKDADGSPVRAIAVIR
jgi:arylformamidase